MAGTRLKVTKENFKKLPEGPPYYEFERGDLIEVSRPHPWHNFAVYLLASFLWSLCPSEKFRVGFHGQRSRVADGCHLRR